MRKLSERHQSYKYNNSGGRRQYYQNVEQHPLFTTLPRNNCGFMCSCAGDSLSRRHPLTKPLSSLPCQCVVRRRVARQEWRAFTERFVFACNPSRAFFPFCDSVRVPMENFHLILYFPLSINIYECVVSTSQRVLNTQLKCLSLSIAQSRQGHCNLIHPERRCCW